MSKPTNEAIDVQPSIINIPANSPNILFQFSLQDLIKAENALKRLVFDDPQAPSQPAPEKRSPKLD